MGFIRLFALLGLAIITKQVNAQTESSFGNFTQDEVLMKTCTFDKEADAVILLDIAKAYPSDYSLITERRVRIKILKESAVERGNIKIPFVSVNDFETLSNIEGLVYNKDDNGNAQVIQLEKSGIFRQKINSTWSELKLAMPGVKVGSIIEYKYQSVMKSWSGLDKWEFQQDIPTVLSRYDLTILPGAEFAYNVFKRSDLKVSVKSVQQEGRIVYEMMNIAGLRYEPFSDANAEYQQRVIFQLSKYQTDYGYKQRYADSWSQLAKDLTNDENFGRPINKSINGSSSFIAEVKALPTEIEKLTKIYTYVRKNFQGDGMRSIYANKELKTVWDKKIGNTGERNLLLINLLKEAKLDVTPLLVCGRSEGKVRTSYPFLDQFKKVVALVKLGGKDYVLDATDQHTPIGMIPFDLVNTLAFAVLWKNAQPPFLLEASDKSLKSVMMAQSRITENGNITGTISFSLKDYEKIDHARFIEEEGQTKYIKKHLLIEGSDFTVDSFKYEGLAQDSTPLVLNFGFRSTAPKSGNYYLVDMNLLGDFKKSPFVSDIRFTDINFGTKVSETITQTLKLPATLKPDALPKNIKLTLPDKSVSLERLIAYDNTLNEIQSRIVLTIDRPVFPSNEYPTIKEFFKKMVDLINEPLVLTPK